MKLILNLFFFLGVVRISSVDGTFVRLAGGHAGRTGRIEVSKNGTDWGTVCDDLWTDREAQVVCRQLNFQWGTAYTSARFGEGTGDIYLDNVQCTGTERNLDECQHNGWGNNNCRHYEDAGVACYNSSVRLKSRGRTDVGTVEIRVDDGWVEVCDEKWDNADAKVLCREMGHLDGQALCCSKLGVEPPKSSDRSASKSFTEFTCQGHEKTLFACGNQTQDATCESDHRASAICYNTTMDKVNMDFDVRLGNGSDPNRYWGEVNVRHMGVWGQVCSMGDNWDDTAANIVCKQLGFKGGSAYGTVQETFMPSWIVDMNCTGKEISLEQCAKKPWGRPVRSCKPAFALCFKIGISVKLVDGGSYYGRVEITHDNHTGTICDKAWSTSDARVVCKKLGYNDGDPVTGSVYGPGTGPVMMSGLGCYGYETNIVQCRNKGWMTFADNDYCKDHKKDASVVCYKDVRLFRGDHSHGVVQIMEDNWSVLCGEGFTDNEAKVVCKELGFEDGMALAMGSFGTFYGKYVRPNISCTTDDNSILNCTYDKFRACQKDSFLGYAVVSCFNGTLSKDKQMKLEGGDTSLTVNQTGRVSVQQYGIWGRVCPNSWDDKDATVVCIQLGFAGGVAYKYTSSGYGPYTLGKVGCQGNESKLFDCPVSSGLCNAQFSSGDAGVLCYSHTKPALRLVGSANSGHLEIILDALTGTICDLGWSLFDASVACKQLGFQYGEPRSNYPATTGGTVVMSSIGCYGGESSIFMCLNPGWQKNIHDRCFEANRNAGVFCYNNVRISGGQNNDNNTAGRVEMYHHNSWLTVCAEGFDDNDARIVCKELGFPNSKALVAGEFGRRYFSKYATQFNCTGKDLASCKFNETATCKDRSSNYASVLCSKFKIDNKDVRVLPFNSFPATVIVEKHGMNGTICAEGWDNKDADVLCRQLRYNGGGVAFGPHYSGSSTPIWMTDVKCNGTESRLHNCTFKQTPTSVCLSNHMAARVYCYEGSGFNIRLVGGPSSNEGRVEVSYGGKWGTICDSYWADEDARVVCRQLGFLDGVARPSSFYGQGTGPSWLYYVRCYGDEKSIWSCFNSGFNVSHTTCRNHKYDASVYCTNKVRLEPNVTYGAVEIWNKDSDNYQLVCADRFDDVAAKVVCNSMGFKNGISVCCSAFGSMKKYKIAYNDVKCSGTEKSILECTYLTEMDRCKSKKYASVACSNQPASGEYVLKLSNNNRGSVSIKHFDIWGHICADGFDDTEAMAICRELKYTGGFTYYQIQYHSSKISGIPWLSNVNCSGDESYLGKCGNIRWGSVASCDTKRRPAVYCYKNEGYKLRLANGSNSMSGRPEISLDGVWGTICGFISFGNVDAEIICREMNYTGGHKMKSGSFGRGKGKVHITRMNCKSNVTSIMQCPIKFSDMVRKNSPLRMANRSWVYSGYRSRYTPLNTCLNHDSDAAIQCYDSGFKVRLVNGSTPLSGRVEICIDGHCGAICAYSYTAYFMSSFGKSEADVICRALNYSGGQSLKPGSLGSEGRLMMIGIKCDSNATSKIPCQIYWYRSGMMPHKTLKTYLGGQYTRMEYAKDACLDRDVDVAVQCFDSVRLSGTNDLNYGYLELFEDDKWNAVCDDKFQNVSARVACRQLGYKDGRFQPGSVLGTKVKVNTTIIDLRCNGDEKSLKTCTYNHGTCPTNNYVTIYCEREIMKPKDKLELRIKSKRYYGTLEANKYGFWGPICPIGWTDSNAKSACQQLGYIGGVVFNGTTRVDSPMALGNFSCTGSQILSDCSYRGFNENIGTACQYPITGRYSSQRPAAGVLCYNHKEGVQFRLSESPRRGRVEIMFNGKWGRVCNSSWGDKEASVFCKQKGFIDGKSQKFAGRSKAHVWMNYIDCGGDEKSILECANMWTPGTANCDDAGAVCFDSVRLSKGQSQSNGAVEVHINGKWGLVCNHNWDQTDVNITCSQLGYETGIPLCCAPYGYMKSRGSMENIQCKGDEASLDKCRHSVPFGSVCSMDYAAATCYNGSRDTSANVSISGVGGSQGSVEITFMNISGRVCADGWDDLDAQVVCRQMGFAFGKSYRHYKWNTGRGENAPFWTSNVNCTGNETTLQDCPHTQYGQVKECASRHFAGVLCYNKYGVSYRLAGGESGVRHYGRVEVSVDGVWGSLCNRYWDINDAKVLCRSQGYVTGFPLYTGKFQDPPVKVYQSNLHCNGSEETLQHCPHEGWGPPKAKDKCDDHSKDAAAYCYTSVNIGSGVSKHITNGPVFYYNKEHKDWEAICDKGFNDFSATLVCQNLGFDFGKAIAGSAYGKIYAYVYENVTLNCNEDSKILDECKKTVPCNDTDYYASVACFKKENQTLDEGYEFAIQKGEAGDFSGIVTVKHFGLPGRVCSQGWDDTDAMVLCRGLSHQHGIAFHQSDNDFAPLLGRGPYWIGNIDCDGSEVSLDKCTFSDRLQNKNCTGRTNAAVMCYNDGGIQYRIVLDKDKDMKDKSYGRVEIAVNNVWGTVCDASWDNKDARVLCRSKGYHDGYALVDAHYGASKGTPMWLSHLKCTGTEESLHKCPHRGFDSRVMDGSVGWWKCKSHKDDASVFCIRDLQLSTGFNATMGAVQVYHNNQWYAVCDSSFDSRDARVVCRTLGFVDGKAVHGSAFGNLTVPIGVNSVQCDGNEPAFKECKKIFAETCTSGMYASVYCSAENIVDRGNFSVRIRPDYGKKTANYHGFLEVHIDGVWGGVCGDDSWDDKAANVSCLQMGYKGGVAYKPPKNFTSPILMDSVKCTGGSEPSLHSCSYKPWTKLTGCDYYSQRAGVFCYNDSGLVFRLGEGEADRGRVEMKYNGVWGGICDWLWDSRDAKVFCRNIGYADGLEVVGARYGHSGGPLWFTRVSCKGHEASILQCRHTGFNSSDEMEGVYAGLCRSRSNDAAAQCYNQKLEVTKMRLVNSDKKLSYGRVEVYMTGANQWGTVCDDYWGDKDAKVVCRQMGYADGRGVKGAHFGRGTGPIWLDNLRCLGNETKLVDCPHNSFAVQNCNHGEDAGVYCTGRGTSPEGPPITSESRDEKQEGDSIVIGVTVSIIVILIAIIGIGGFILYRRSRPSGEIKKILVQNDMNDPNPQPPPATDGSVTLSKLRARFSKKLSESDGDVEQDPGVSNPVYEDDRSKGIIMEEASIEQPTKFDVV